MGTIGRDWPCKGTGLKCRIRQLVSGRAFAAARVGTRWKVSVASRLYGGLRAQLRGLQGLDALGRARIRLVTPVPSPHW